MALFIASLNSGSNGNCYYIGDEQDAVLIDAGISCRETEKRMKRLGLPMERLRGIFVSHEHTDHINGIPSLVKKFRLPLYITRRTLVESRLDTLHPAVTEFRPYETVQIGQLSITAFPKFHDAIDPYSFTISSANTTIGVFTDIGRACTHVIAQFSRCHAAFLEANYDEEMLASGAYPEQLKRRIRGGDGHLSNREALELFRKHRNPFLSHLILSHLSENNNHPEKAIAVFRPYCEGLNLVVAGRYGETPLFRVEGLGPIEPRVYRFSAYSSQLRFDFPV